jgi:hypothetical protein
LVGQRHRMRVWATRDVVCAAGEGWLVWWVGGLFAG